MRIRRKREGVVGIVATLRLAQLFNLGSFPDAWKRFFSSKHSDLLWVILGTRGSFAKGKATAA